MPGPATPFCLGSQIGVISCIGVIRAGWTSEDAAVTGEGSIRVSQGADIWRRIGMAVRRLEGIRPRWYGKSTTGRSAAPSPNIARRGRHGRPNRRSVVGASRGCRKRSRCRCTQSSRRFTREHSELIWGSTRRRCHRIKAQSRSRSRVVGDD